MKKNQLLLSWIFGLSFIITLFTAVANDYDNISSILVISLPFIVLYVLLYKTLSIYNFNLKEKQNIVLSWLKKRLKLIIIIIFSVLCLFILVIIIVNAKQAYLRHKDAREIEKIAKLTGLSQDSVQSLRDESPLLFQGLVNQDQKYLYAMAKRLEPGVKQRGEKCKISKSGENKDSVILAGPFTDDDVACIPTQKDLWYQLAVNLLKNKYGKDIVIEQFYWVE